MEALHLKEIEAFFYDEPILKYRIRHTEAFNDLETLPDKYRTQFYAFGLSKKRDTLEVQLSQKIMDIIERSEWQNTLKRYDLN